MAEQLNRFTRRMKTFYEKLYNELMPGMTGIDDFLFSVPDVDADSANFALDELVKNVHGVSFRHRGEQAAVRPYEAGTGHIYEVPRTSEKTTITERIRDAVITGGEETEAFTSREARVISQILRQHTIAHMITRWKLALDVIRTGIYYPTGLQGQDLGLGIDFKRSKTLDLVYDFEESGADINQALKELYDAYIAMNGPGENLTIIMGQSWIKEFAEDTIVLEYMKANTANILLRQNLNPPIMRNVQGLKIVAEYLIPGTVDMVTICSYRPQARFIAYKGATPQAYMPDDEAIMFSAGDTRYKVLRGVDVLSDAGKVIRAVGDIVFDTFTTPDPVETNLRSSARYSFVPADVNHTARSTGSFES
jgi:hypothetical protein